VSRSWFLISPTNRRKLAARNIDDIFNSGFEYRIDAICYVSSIKTIGSTQRHSKDIFTLAIIKKMPIPSLLAVVDFAIHFNKNLQSCDRSDKGI